MQAAVRSIRHEPDGAVVVRVSWIDPPRVFLTAVAEYLMIAGTGLTPAQLRAGGLPLRTAERAVTFGNAAIPHDEQEILDLRFRAHQHEGRLPGMTRAPAGPTRDRTPTGRRAQVATHPVMRRCADRLRGRHAAASVRGFGPARRVAPAQCPPRRRPGPVPARRAGVDRGPRTGPAATPRSGDRLQ